MEADRLGAARVLLLEELPGLRAEEHHLLPGDRLYHTHRDQ